MSEPIKPRIDFDEPLQPPQEPALRAGVAFDAEQAESFFGGAGAAAGRGRRARRRHHQRRAET